LMVSSEGACAAYYQYGDVEKIHDLRAAIGADDSQVGETQAAEAS